MKMSDIFSKKLDECQMISELDNSDIVIVETIYNDVFYNKLSNEFNSRINVMYECPVELIAKILTEWDLIDELTNIIKHMPTWFKDTIKMIETKSTRGNRNAKL